MQNFFSRFYDTDKVQSVNPSAGFGVITNTQPSESQKMLNASLFPAVNGYSLDGIAEEPPQKNERIHDRNDGSSQQYQQYPKGKTDNALAELFDPSFGSFLVNPRQQTHQHPYAHSAHKVVNHSYFLSCLSYIYILSWIRGFVNP
jgi:hypothetical protein